MHTYTRSKTLLILVSALALSVGGCDAVKGKKKGKKGKANKALKKAKANAKRAENERNARAAADAHARSQPGYAMGQKLNHYITCINGLSGSLNRTASRYFSWASSDPKKPPSARTRIVYGLYSVHSTQLQKCNKALDTLPAEPDTPKLTKAGEAYKAAVKTLVPLVGDAFAYYNKKRYKQDGLKLGAKLHPQLVKAFNDFRDADRGMRDEVGRINDDLQMAALKRMEASGGRNLNYYWKLNMYYAKKMVRLASVNEPKDVDTKTMDSVAKDFIPALKSLRIYINGNHDEAKRYRGLRNFMGALGQYAVQLDALLARAKNKNIKYTHTEKFHLKTKHAENIKGHPAAVVKAYNNLVNKSNQM